MTGVLIERGHVDPGMPTESAPGDDEHKRLGRCFDKPRKAKDGSKARRKAWSRFCHTALRRKQPYQHLDIRLLASKTVSETIDLCGLSHSAGGTLFQQP